MGTGTGRLGTGRLGTGALGTGRLGTGTLGREATTLDRSEVTAEVALDTAVGIAVGRITVGDGRLGATTGTEAGKLVGRGITGLRSEDTTEVTFAIGSEGMAVPVGTGPRTLGRMLDRSEEATDAILEIGTTPVVLA